MLANNVRVVPSCPMTTRRTILRSALALVPALAAVACATDGQRPLTADSKQVGGTRHSSGLLVVTRDSLDRHPTDAIKPVVGFCDNLSGLFPDEFGFAYGVSDVAVLGIATDSGQDLYDKWRSDRGLPADARPDPEGKFIPALNDQAREMAGMPVQLERVGRSRAQVEALQHSIDMQDPAFADAKVGMTHVDRPTSLVIIHMETLTDKAAARLVELYGTEHIAVLLERGRSFSANARR